MTLSLHQRSATACRIERDARTYGAIAHSNGNFALAAVLASASEACQDEIAECKAAIDAELHSNGISMDGILRGNADIDCCWPTSTAVRSEPLPLARAGHPCLCGFHRLLLHRRRHRAGTAGCSVMQIGALLPRSVPCCGHGHRPSIVTTVGAPQGHRIGAPAPAMFHIECHQCGLATVPTPHRALAESRWTDPTQAANRVPISQLPRARQQACAALCNAA